MPSFGVLRSGPPSQWLRLQNALIVKRSLGGLSAARSCCKKAKLARLSKNFCRRWRWIQPTIPFGKWPLTCAFPCSDCPRQCTCSASFSKGNWPPAMPCGPASRTRSWRGLQIQIVSRRSGLRSCSRIPIANWRLKRTRARSKNLHVNRAYLMRWR